VVGLAEEQSRCHIARNEREVGTVVAIEHLLGTGGANDSHERVVVIWVTAIEPVRHAVYLVLAHNVGAVLVRWHLLLMPTA